MISVRWRTPGLLSDCVSAAGGDSGGRRCSARTWIDPQYAIGGDAKQPYSTIVVAQRYRCRDECRVWTSGWREARGRELITAFDAGRYHNIENAGRCDTRRTNGGRAAQAYQIRGISLGWVSRVVGVFRGRDLPYGTRSGRLIGRNLRTDHIWDRDCGDDQNDRNHNQQLNQRESSARLSRSECGSFAAHVN
jgi:hypothetical protein